MLPDITLSTGFTLAPHEFEFSFSRSSGAGGQNVNKVNSKATLRWLVTQSGLLPADVRMRFLNRYASKLTTLGEIIISSDRHRDQARNVDDCIQKLKEMLNAVARSPKKRRATKPSRGSKERRLNSKKTHSNTKQTRGRVRGED